MNYTEETEIVETVSRVIIASAGVDYVPFADIVWQLRDIIRGADNTVSYSHLKSLAMVVAKILLNSGLCVFQFEKDTQGQFVVVPWSSQQPESVESRILAEWDLLVEDPNPGDICWFKK
jgi:hypothetical protein